MGGFQIRAVFGPRSRRFARSGSSSALAAKPATGANVAATRANGKAASTWLNRFQIRRAYFALVRWSAATSTASLFCRNRITISPSATVYSAWKGSSQICVRPGHAGCL